MRFPRRLVHRGLLALAVSVFFVPAQAAQGAEGELLYNGIRLPEAWPPRDLEPKSRKPMPVPYLAAPPAVIPIDIGRQLFVDDFLIEKTTLRREFHRAQKYEGNPVLKPETPQEMHGLFSHSPTDPTATACPFDDGVFFDPQERLFKMWYMAGFFGPTCLATSEDGLHWKRPPLDVLAGTNISIPANHEFLRDGFTPWLDWAARNAKERWKAFLYARLTTPPDTKRRGAAYLYTSPDGAHWQQRATVKAEVGDNTTIFYNPFRKKLVMSARQSVSGRGRARFYGEVDDFFKLADLQKDDFVYWAAADELDLPDPEIGTTPQLYCLSPIAYESLMVCALAIHFGPENDVCMKGKFPKLTEIELGFSRDGFHFSRPDRERFIAATKREGDADRGYVRPAGSVCCVVGDRLYFYYSAFSGIAPDGQKHFYAGGSTHVATLRRDGFASMEADAAGGELLTRPLAFKGAHLFVNAIATNGELRAEVLDLKGQVIAPYTLANCVPVTIDGTRTALHWSGAEDLRALAGQPVQLRFTLKNASLFAFWVSPEKSGASHGYVAAGGPEFTGPTDETGK